MRTGSPNGWQFFAATLMMMIGAVNIIQGLVALLTPTFYAVAGGELLLLEYGAWGLLLGGWGLVLVVAGAAVLSGSTWARVFGIVLAAVNALAQLAFLVALPLWSLVAIAIDLLVIYALTAGWPDREIARDRDETVTDRMADDQHAAYRSGRRAAHAKPESQRTAPAEDAAQAPRTGDRRHPV
ncbi:hypothetical protein DFP74_0280 [Nocardiopsis sp. Huas11]|uniref:DUF7144 family membrane protein n=1 Tax=Nocardiopsis sp. Huas11 TaxID=2183912 RepID=UPI000F1D69B3|nr:hypothetical protein [Nocardiopsis sp. Huas11]RKS04710.1 hypothetical protein DFP74_0280 [Nocardiopsis sp. Huas11]